MQTIPVILDTDPGIDDAVALAAAIFSPHIDLKLITTVAGNVGVAQTTRNALQLLEFWNEDIPVAQGARRPLCRPQADAAHIHGESGMDGYAFAPPRQSPLIRPAFMAMAECLQESSRPVTLVTIGPLTNVALLLAHSPDCKTNISRIVMMGGSAGRGNFTPNAEFNIAIDPEAAAQVMESGIEIVMCGLDVTNRAVLTPDYMARLKTQSKTGKMLHSLFSHYRSGSLATGLRMHDLCAIAWLVHPELFQLVDCYVGVETQGTLTAGVTVVDLENRFNRPANVRVAMDIDVDGFRHWVEETLALAP